MKDRTHSVVAETVGAIAAAEVAVIDCHETESRRARPHIEHGAPQILALEGPGPAHRRARGRAGGPCAPQRAESALPAASQKFWR